MIASDGKIEIPDKEVPHPRAYGTFPRVLAKFVREEGVLTLPQAIRKMTSLPALAMGFYDRGLLRPGMQADLVVLDPGTIQDRATFSDPHQYPAGIDAVIVNGKIALNKGVVKNHKGGKILYGHGKQNHAM